MVTDSPLFDATCARPTRPLSASYGQVDS
jgi:hypothetical protein